MKLFKNKLFLMLFATLFAICLFNSSSVFAFNVNDENSDVSFELPDFLNNGNYYYYFGGCLAYDDYVTYCLVISDAPILYSLNPNNSEYAGLSASPDYTFIYRQLVTTCPLRDCQSFLSSLTEDNFSTQLEFASLGFSIETMNHFTVNCCNHNIVEKNNEEHVVFQAASQPVEETNQVVLAEIVEQQETNKVMEEILGILPVVIVVIVSLIAIRKAIAFLVTFLHRS